MVSEGATSRVMVFPVSRRSKVLDRRRLVELQLLDAVGGGGRRGGAQFI